MPSRKKKPLRPPVDRKPKPTARAGATPRPGPGTVPVRRSPAGLAVPVAPVVNVVVGPPAPRDEAKSHVDSVRALKSKIQTHFFQMGLHLRELSRPEMYRALGHPNFKDLLEKQGLPSRMTARKLIAIVDHFDEPFARARGIEWCSAVIRYAEKKAGADVHALIARNPVLPGIRRRLLDASATEIEAAIAHQGGPGFSADKKRETQIEASNLARHFRRRGARGARTRTVEGRTGWVIRLELTAADSRTYRA
jgi:hypothetical protein